MFKQILNIFKRNSQNDIRNENIKDDSQLYNAREKIESRKLTFQLVPSTAWYSNLRSILSNWDDISKKVRKCGQCSICGEKTHKLDAHEVWSYDDCKHTQNLVDIIAVCKKCHQSIHVGFAQVKGNEEEALEWYSKVNGITMEEAISDEEVAFFIWQARSNQEWEKDEEALLDMTEKLTGIKGKIKEPVNGRYYLNVPYAEKDEVKQLGAKWDYEEKKWYYTEKSDEKKFDKWRAYRR